MKWQFVLAEDWGSRLIAWYGQGYGGWSHVDAVMPSGWLLGARDDLITAGGMNPVVPGVRLRPPNYEKWIRRQVVSLPCTPAQDATWMQFLERQIGKPYDSGAIWAFITGRREPNAPGYWICSALQMGAARAAVKAYPTLIPDSQITPDAYYILCTAGWGGVVTEHASQ